MGPTEDRNPFYYASFGDASWLEEFYNQSFTASKDRDQNLT